MSAPKPVAPPQFGEPAPLFVAATDGVDRYGFDVAGGRWIVLLVFATLGLEACAKAHAAILARRQLFDDANVLRVGDAYEKATPWRERRPALAARATLGLSLPLASEG